MIKDGSVTQRRVPASETELELSQEAIVGVSGNFAQLTHVVELRLDANVLTEIPSGVLVMTQLLSLRLRANRLIVVPREIGRLTALTHLYLHGNKLAALPREIGRLSLLRWLDLDDNVLTSVPAELGDLRSLQWLFIQGSRLTWLPIAVDRLPLSTKVFLNENPLPIDVGSGSFLMNSRHNFPDLFAATTALAMIREQATVMAIGLQDLELPALVTLEIIDAAFRNSIPMHKKWDLVTAVKHFHQRRGIERQFT